jgi:predicted anti-sigma-YlaC factor YlaD
MNQTCDHHQETLSDCLDEKRPLPKATLEHLSHCEGCRAFHDMWKQDSGPLATLAGIRDLPEVPPSLAQNVAAARKTVAGLWRRKLRHGWPAIAAAVALAPGVIWWNSGSDPAPENPVVGIQPDIQPVPNDTVDLPRVISAVYTDGLQRGFSAYTRARARSLDKSGHRLARLTLNLREATTNFPEFIPTVE